MIDVSIVIVSYNISHYLFDCIVSIVNCTEKYDFEIIVVHNGPDNKNSEDSLEYLGEQYSVIPLRMNNRGYGAACNFGMKHAQGEFIVVMNDDIVLVDNAIDKLVNYLKADYSIGAIAPRLLNGDGSIQISYSRDPSIISNISHLILPNKIFASKVFIRIARGISKRLSLNLGRLSEEPTIPEKVECVMGAFFVTRKDIFQITGGFDEDNFFMFAEEGDWFLRIRKADYSIIYYPFANVVHYGGSTVKKFPALYTIQQYKSFYNFYLKHRGILIVWMYILIMSSIFSFHILFTSLLALTLRSRRKILLPYIEAYIVIIYMYFNANFRKLNVMKDVDYKFIEKLPQ